MHIIKIVGAAADFSMRYGHLPIWATMLAMMGGWRFDLSIKKNGRWHFSFHVYKESRK